MSGPRANRVISLVVDDGFEISAGPEDRDEAGDGFDPIAAAEALRLMADKASGYADCRGQLDPTSELVRSAADLLRAANDWLDHHRTLPFEVRAGERVLRALEEGAQISCSSFMMALRETAMELGCLDPLGHVSPLTLPPSAAMECGDEIRVSSPAVVRRARDAATCDASRGAARACRHRRSEVFDLTDSCQRLGTNP